MHSITIGRPAVAPAPGHRGTTLGRPLLPGLQAGRRLAARAEADPRILADAGAPPPPPGAAPALAAFRLGPRPL